MIHHLDKVSKQREFTLNGFIGYLSDFNIEGLTSLPRFVRLFMYLVFPPQSPVCQCGDEDADFTSISKSKYAGMRYSRNLCTHRSHHDRHYVGVP